ncbi:hypothetical protein B0J12DRAFT_417504 [Macrophomina phaseolina]|uniref:DUF7924 domain-containing protein n=1 Tax=Macrophomina phaseolina TaxID=35725 RepID=A0ABQ8FSI6_9PEZI|nr:hypothetical protein B0J12DRAFT_417504 [Macrophomina phaseolina]
MSQPARGTVRKRELHDSHESTSHISEPSKKRIRRTPTNVEPRSDDCSDPVDYWRRHNYWPRSFSRPDPTMNHLLARKKSSSSSLRRQALGADSVSNSNTTSSSVQYQNPLYKQHIAKYGVFMHDDEDGVADASVEMYISLFEAEQTVPQVSLFCDRLFKSTCRNIENKNEARVVRDIALLIVPSAEQLVAEGATHLDYLIESTDETWSASVKIYGPKPKPDFSVGFRWDKFTEEHTRRLEPFIGDLEDESVFKATSLMYFPFLTCEVKCGTAALDVADRQNAHSMGIAVRAVVELFRLVNREEELQRTILGFAISHDHRMVRIYGYYPVIKGKETTYYRQAIDAFDFTVQNGRDRWKSYKFVKNIYERWVPQHFRRICSAIDEIPPNVNFAVSQRPASVSSEQTGLSQEIFNCGLDQSAESPESNEEPGIVAPEDATPDTSVSSGTSDVGRKRKHQSSI